jgi:hypothetical protein
MSGPEVRSSPSIHIRTTEHQLTQAEIVPVVYWQAFHRWRNWCLPVAALGLIIIGLAVATLDSADRVAWVVLLASGLVVALIFVTLVPLTPDRIWKRTKQQFAVRTLEIYDEGISRHTALNDSTMRWAMFSEMQRRGDLYLLMVGKGPGCFIIPGRAFTSPTDEASFRALAERSLAAASGPQES